jgi:ribosome-associated protein
LIREAEFLTALELARKAAEAASDKQAIDIVLLDVRGVCSFADYFVIISGTSDKQIEAISDEVEETLKKEGSRPIHREGAADSGWVVLDFVDVVVHIFAPFEREFYQLEQLWSEAIPVVRIQ